MTGKSMLYLSLAAALAVVVFLGWRLTARSAYESAAYSVLTSEGPYETRDYPDLMLATTNSQFAAQGDDGSFMRLFRYISGANDREQKVAMTTPVFMEPEVQDSPGQMGFVIPRTVSEQGVPAPQSEEVKILQRPGGRFAVIRFAGRLSEKTAKQSEEKLRAWMTDKGLTGDGLAELAGYDPPWTPGPFRRNEVLIRLR